MNKIKSSTWSNPLQKKTRIRHLLGFTLIEITVVIALVALCGIAMSKFFSQSLILSANSKTTVNAISTAQNAMEHLAQDIRQLRSNNDISVFSSTQFSFIDSSGNSNNYVFSSNTLSLNSQTLLSNVASLAFSYYDKNGSITATQANIRYIKIQLQLSGNASSIQLSTIVFPRVFTN